MPVRYPIQQLDIGGESTFGTAAGTFRYLRAMVVDIADLTKQVVRDEHARQGDYEVARLMQAYRGTVTTRHYLHGFNTSIPSSAPTQTSAEDAGASAFDNLIQAIGSAFGNVHVGGHSAADTVGYDASPPGITGVLSSFVPGQAIAWATAVTAWPYEVGWLKAINTGATPDEGALLQVPRVQPQGDTIWGAHTAFIRDGDPFHDGACKSWSLRLRGEAADHYYVALGCRPIGFKVSIPSAKQATIEITWGVAHVTRAGSGGGPLTAQSWAYPVPAAAAPWRVALGDSSPIELQVASVEFDLGLTRNAIEGGASQSGVEGWYTATRVPTVTMSVFRTYSREIADFAAQTGRPWTVHYGSQPGDLFSLCLPNARVVEDPKPTDGNGAVMSQLKLEGHYYAGDTGSLATTPYNSPARMAFL